MKNGNIAKAEKEVIRFMEKLEEYKNSEHYNKDHHYCYPSPERAALRRSSMDLTKALSKMRQV